MLVGQEGFQNRVRVAFVEVVADDFQHAAPVKELCVDRPHRRVLRAVDALLDVQHQDLVQLHHRLGRPVVAAHQHFGRALAVRGLVAEALGHGGLQVEHQPVFAPARHHVQPRADQLQAAFVALQLLDLERRDQALGRQLVPVLAQPRSARHPDHHLQVAQAARAFLAVGFQRVGRVLELAVALVHFERLRAQKGLGVHRLRVGAPEAVEDAPVTAQVARFEQGGLHRHVALALDGAFVQRAHAGADFQADVPAGGDEGFDRCLAAVVASQHVARQQHQHVHIGVRKQLAAAVAAHRQQRASGGHAGVLPQVEQRLVNVLRQRAQQARSGRRGGARGGEVLQQRRLAFAKARTQLAHAAGSGARVLSRQTLFERGHGLSGARGRLRLRRRPAAAGCRPTA